MTSQGMTPHANRELRALLRCWQVFPRHNPSFQDEVWRRIHRKESTVGRQWQRRGTLP